MRDTVILGVIVVAFVAFMMWKPAAAPSGLLTQGASHETHAGTDQRSQIADRKGVQQSHRQDPAIETERAHANPEESSSESEKISSIYSGKKLKAAASKKAAKAKVVHGVPLEDFIDAKQDALPMYDVTQGKPNGVRMFVQCMEVKKGNTLNLSEQQCAELTMRTPSRRPRY